MERGDVEITAIIANVVAAAVSSRATRTQRSRDQANTAQDAFRQFGNRPVTAKPEGAHVPDDTLKHTTR